MQNKEIDLTATQENDREDLIDTLIAISVVAKKLANMLRDEKRGEEKHGKNERTVPNAG